MAEAVAVDEDGVEAAEGSLTRRLELKGAEDRARLGCIEPCAHRKGGVEDLASVKVGVSGEQPPPTPQLAPA